MVQRYTRSISFSDSLKFYKAQRPGKQSVWNEVQSEGDDDNDENPLAVGNKPIGDNAPIHDISSWALLHQASRPVLNRLGEVAGTNGLGASEVGNGAGKLEDAVKGAGGKG